MKDLKDIWIAWLIVIVTLNLLAYLYRLIFETETKIIFI